MEFKSRKANRLSGYDYNTSGAYFITICTKNRARILSNINVGTGVLDCPDVELLEYGKISDKYINQLNDFYDNIIVDKYVIMPNHIHLLISVRQSNGQSGTPVPTNGIIDNKNSVVSKFVSTFKRFCNKEYNQNIWQDRYYDHIVRSEQDYNEILEYIQNNPLKWETDDLFTECDRI
jgi:REP element-mobilizing transposase RayT